MKMTVEELISMLEDYPGDAEVRIMSQPSYPLVEVCAGVVSKKEIAENEAAEDEELCDVCGMVPVACECEECDCPLAEEIEDDVVYLVADGHPDDEAYGKRIAWDVMRRS